MDRTGFCMTFLPWRQSHKNRPNNHELETFVQSHKTRYTKTRHATVSNHLNWLNCFYWLLKYWKIILYKDMINWHDDEVVRGRPYKIAKNWAFPPLVRKMAQSFPSCPFGHTINFEKSYVFAPTIAGVRICRTPSSLSALDKPPDWGRLLWTAPFGCPLRNQELDSLVESYRHEKLVLTALLFNIQQ